MYCVVARYARYRRFSSFPLIRQALFSPHLGVTKTEILYEEKIFIGARVCFVR